MEAKSTAKKSAGTKKAVGKKVAAKKAVMETAKIQGAAARQARKNSAPKEVTGASEWKKEKTQGFPLEVPSGKVALVRPVGMQAFLTQGHIPNSLREIAMEAISQRKAPELKVEELTAEQIGDMLTAFDNVCVFCTVAPKVAPIPKFTNDHHIHGFCTEEEVGDEIPMDHELRDDDILYVDEVDLEDKTFIFQFACGGTRNVEQFRAEYAGRMEHLLGESNMADQAK